MIIDMRCRLTTADAGDYFHVRSADKGVRDDIAALEDRSEESFFAEITASGITTAVSVSGNSPGTRIAGKDIPNRTTDNDYMADVQTRHWGRFIGVAGIDAGGVFHEPEAEIERCAALGLRTVFIEPGRSPGCLLDDKKLYGIYQKCVEHDMTLIPQTGGMLGGKLIAYADPKHIDQVAEDFPDLRIVCGHAHYPYVREAIAVAMRRENVYLSPDLYLQELGTEDWLKAVNEDIRGFASKFLFGSAYPLIPIQKYVDEFMGLPWEEERLEGILFGNALRALGLEDDPTFRDVYGLARPLTDL